MSSTINGSNGIDTINGTSANNLINADGGDLLTGGDDIVFARGGADTVNGELGADLLFGQGGGDSLSGGGGDDELVGGLGADTLHGGDGTDVAGYEDAVFGDPLNAITFTDLGPGTGWRVTTGTEGTDTIFGVEIVTDADGGRVLLVGSGGFATLQEAIDEAQSGDTILIAAGAYAGATISGKALTIIGRGDDATTVVGQILVTGVLDGEFILQDLAVDADGADYGVYVTASSTDFAGSVTLDGVAISDAGLNGFAYIRAGNGGAPTLADTVGSVTITGSSFTGNATSASGAGGRGDILLFGYNGDLTITDTSITSPGANAQKAIQMRGVQSGGDVAGVGPFAPAGNIVLSGLTIDGAYANDVIAFYRMAEFASFTGSGNSVTATRGTSANPNATLEPWALINFDSVGGTVDLTGFFTVASNTASPDGSPGSEVPGTIAQLQGLATAETLTGTDGADLLIGRGGADVLNAGDGNDTILGDTGVATVPGAGADSISAGGGNDLILAATTELPDTAIDGGGGADTLRIISGTGAVVLGAEVAGVETIEVAAGSNAVDINAGAAAGVTAITGNDAANALFAGGGAQTVTGNGGNDTLAGGEGDDSLVGGSDIDTVVFTGVLTAEAFSVVDGKWVVVSGAEGTDTLATTEIVQADGARFLLVGAGGYLTIQAAVDAAASSDTILVAPGTYNENVVIGTSGITLLSVDGREATIIAGNDSGAQLGAVQFTPGLNGVRLGDAGMGFTILGLNGNGAIEKGAIYLQGNQTGHVIEGNDIVADGDAGLTSEFGGDLDDLTITGNIFSGQTFVGEEPEGNGFGTQFDVGNNVPRQLVVLGNGGGTGQVSSNIVFTDNQVTGTAGGTNGIGPQGNTLVTIDAQDSLVEDNTFTGFTDRFATAIRVRGPGTDVIGNILDHTGGGASRGIFVQNANGNSVFSDNVVAGGEGADAITSMTPGADSVDGAGGADTLITDDGMDTVLGGTGADVIVAGGGADSVDAGADNDLIAGTIAQIAPDVIAGGMGTDTLRLTDTAAGSIVLDTDITGVERIEIRVTDTVLGAAAIDVDASALTGVGAILGNDGANTLTAGADAQTLTGLGGNDTLAGGEGNDALVGGGGIDTASYASGLTIASFSLVGGAWQVDAGVEGIDSLDGVEAVSAGGVTYRLVGAGGYGSIQAAIDAADPDDVILIAPGTYTETSAGLGGGEPQGLYINKAGLTLVGFSGATGLAVASAQEAKDSGPIVIAGEQNQFGANHWIDVGGTGTVLRGLHLQAGPETNNKLLEIWADATIVEDNYLNVGTTTAIAIYLNETVVGPTDAISSYDIRDNILNEGIAIASGVGDPAIAPTAASDERITGNAFEGSFDPLTGAGRFDTIIINGQAAGIGFLIEPTGTPWIAGNTLVGNTTPFLLRGLDNSADNLPDAAAVTDFLANNGDATTTYAYALDDEGELVTITRDFGAGPVQSFFVMNNIGTLNLALDTTPDAVFGGQRLVLRSTDTLIVQSGAATTASAILVDDVTVQASANSLDLNLTLGTTLVDGTPIASGGVVTLTLGDHGIGLGADVDVTGNALGNVITGNSGANRIDGAAGNDTLVGGAGSDTLLGGADDDVIGTDGGDSIDGGGGTDEVQSSVGFSLATDATDVENLVLTGDDDIAGTGDAGANAITGNTGNNLIDGGAGADAMAGGGGDDTYVVDDLGDTVTEVAGEGADLVLSSVSFTLGGEVEDLTLTGADDIDGTGNAQANTILGNAGANVIDGGAGADAMAGGNGDDTYVVDDADDTVTEAAGEGTDLVLSSVDYTLSAEVENLTLTDGASDLQDFEDFGLGPISDGENGWRYVGGTKDQEVVDVAGDKKFRMSSDPSVGDFSGPYSPALPATAGEPGTTADYDSMQITFNFEAVSPGDNSRLEVDFGIDNGTDRNNFMVIENTAAGIRIAVADPLLSGGFETGGTLNDFTAFTGNRTLVAGVDNEVEHELTMVVRFVDGPDNDVVDFYLNGDFIGSSTTFENFRVAIGQVHETAAEANQVSRLFFRGSAAGAPTDGPGGQNQGFLFDDISASVFDAEGPSGTGNALANTILGNGGANALGGVGGADTLAGGLGADTLTGGEGDDSLDGGLATDTAVFAAALAATDIQASGGGFTVTTGGAEGTDTLANVEIVEGGAGRFLLVGNGGFATLAAALAVAMSGDTILLQGGTQTGTFTIGMDLTILGRDGAAIEGGIVLTAGDLVIEDVAIEQPNAPSAGIQVLATVGNGSLTLSNVDLTGSGSGSGSRGIEAVANAAPVTVTGGTIDAFSSGIYLNPGAGLSVSGTTFTGNAAGIGTEAPALLDVQDATFDGNDEAIGFTGGTLNPEVTLGGNTYVGPTDEVRLYGPVTEVLPGVFDGVVVSAPASLQAALDAADAGETVYVGAGSYGAGPFTVPSAVAAVQGGALVVAGTLQLAAAAALTLLGTAEFDVLGTAGADTVTGNDGANALSGDGGADSLAGGGGGDTLDGGAGADAMAGGAGNDIYVVDDAGDTATEEAAGGTDRVLASVTYTLLDADVEELELTGAAAINGTGNTAANRLIGNGANNVLNGQNGSDTIEGGGGADSVVGAAGNDSLDGGLGIDTVDFSGAAVGITVNVDLIAGQAVGQGSDTLAGIENVSGTNGSDTIAGSNGANRLSGRGGDDEMNGGGGNDSLEGGAGADFLNGGLGTDTAIYGGTAVAVSLTTGFGTAGEALGDVLAAIENLAGGSQGDTLEGDGIGNRIEGFGGNDVLTGLAGNDTLIGGAGTDTVVYATALNSVVVDLVAGTAADGAGGTDTLQTIENVIGGTVADVITGSASNNRLEGGEGDDNLIGNGGSDILLGDGGNDSLDGGGGADTLVGGAGVDIMNGGTENDVFRFLVDSDLGTTRATADRISSFTGAGAAGGDVLDLSALDADLTTGGNQAFTFLGLGDATTQPFTAPGQIRAVQVVASDLTFVEINNDADAAADLVIRLGGLLNLAAGDFLL